MNAAKLVIIFVIVFIFAWYFYGIGNNMENTMAPADNTTTMGKAYENQVGMMGTIGYIIPVALIGFAGYVLYKVFVSGGT